MHSSIVEPRKWLSAICFKGIPWIVGGFNYNRLDSIEKYENKRWTLIDFRLERPLTSVGLACNEAGILILGGKIDFVLHSIGMSVNVRKGNHYTAQNYDFTQKGWDVSAVSFHKVMQILYQKDAMNPWGSIVACKLDST